MVSTQYILMYTPSAGTIFVYEYVRVCVPGVGVCVCVIVCVCVCAFSVVLMETGSFRLKLLPIVISVLFHPGSVVITCITINYYSKPVFINVTRVSLSRFFFLSYSCKLRVLIFNSMNNIGRDAVDPNNKQYVT
jgi:hypothetical protein